MNEYQSEKVNIRQGPVEQPVKLECLFICKCRFLAVKYVVWLVSHDQTSKHNSQN